MNHSSLFTLGLAATILGGPLTVNPVRAQMMILATLTETATPTDDSPYDGVGNSLLSVRNAPFSQSFPAIGGFLNSGNTPFNGSAAFSFQLPTIPAGQVFASATLSLYYEGFLANSGTPAYNVDVFGLRKNSGSGSILASDYAAGTSPGLLLADNYVTTATGGQQRLGNVDVTGFLNGGTGYAANDFVFFGGIADVSSATVGMMVDSRFFFQVDGANATTLPLLTITTAAIPEPSTTALALVGVGAAGVAAYRRRRNRSLAAG